MSEHYFPCGHKMVLGRTCPVCVNAALVAALRAVEYVWNSPLELDLCPECHTAQGNGHAPDCQLAKALKDAEGEPA